MFYLLFENLVNQEVGKTLGVILPVGMGFENLVNQEVGKTKNFDIAV